MSPDDNRRYDSLAVTAVAGLLQGITQGIYIASKFNECMIARGYQKKDIEKVIPTEPAPGTIGVMVDADTGIVIGVSENSPAMEAGIKEGDKIKEVDGLNLPLPHLSETKSPISGEINTVVELVIVRDNKELNISVERK